MSTSLSGRRERRARPFVERLEDRLTPSTLIPVTDRHDLIFDPGRNLLYITTASGLVQRWDVASQQLLPAWNVGADLEGGDITPDGSTLYVTDAVSVTGHLGVLHKVNLSTGAVTDVTYPLDSSETGGWDVAIAPNGNAFITGQGPAYGYPVQEYLPGSNSFTARTDIPGPSQGGNDIQPYSLIHRSPDRKLMVIAGDQSSPEPLVSYDATTDTFPQEVSSPEWSNDSSIAVNRNDNLIAVNASGGPSARIYDASFNDMHDFSGLGGGLAFDPTRDVLYIAEGTFSSNGKIYAYNTNNWHLIAQTPIGESIGLGQDLDSGTMIVSSDGQWLFLNTPSGVREYGINSLAAGSFRISGPSSLTAGSSGSVTVTATDGNGGTLTGYTGTVHFSSSDVLAGLPADYTFTASDNGSHTFNNVTLKTAGTQSITVSDAANFMTGTLTDITVNPAAPDHLAFSVQPSAVAAGSVMSPAVQVQLLDHYGNLATNDSSDAVTLSIAGGPGGFAAGSTTSVTASAGVATFSNLVLDTAGSYTLSASAAGGVSGPASNAFTVSAAAADHLAFLVQPGNNPVGAALNPAVQVQVLDRFGNPVNTDNSDQVTLSVASGPGGFAAGSTTTVTASGGVASFDNLVLNTAGSYTLSASSGSLGGATSTSFAIGAQSADHLAFGIQPSDTLVGAVINPSVTVKVLDRFGNLLASDNSDQVTLAFGSNPAGGTLSGTTTATVSGGVATFADLSIDTAGSYTLAASSSGLSGATSTAFTVRVPPPDHLAFSAQPAAAAAGSALGSVQVELLDQFGHLASGDNSDQVTLSVASGPGGFASGSTTVTASGGIATFSNLVLTTAGTYRLSATATGGLTGANSDGFTVSPAAADHLAFSAQPGNAAAGSGLGATVQMLDAYGNLLTGDNTDAVTLSIASGPGGFASGTTTKTVSGGVAAFSGLVLDTAGTYTLSAGSGSLGGATSTSFTISPLAADHLAFVVAPGDSQAGSPISPAVTVKVVDQFGNTVTSDNTDRVTLSIATGPGGFTTCNSATAGVQAGVATFSNLVLTAAGSYSLSVRTSGGLTGPDSGTFKVSAGSADHLSFLSQPGDGTAGQALHGTVKVQVQDRFGNPLVGDNSDQVTLSVAPGSPGDFDGSSTVKATVSGGVATFSNLVFDTAGTYILEASDGTVSDPGSASFTIFPAAADHLVFSTQPPGTTAGVPIAPAVQVVDRFGNLLANDFTDQVSVSVASGPGGLDSLSTLTAGASAGVATFNRLAFDSTGTYTLAVRGTGLGGVTSASFVVTPGPLDHLAFGVQPGDGVAGQALAQPVTVQLFDAFGNLLTNDSSDSVTLNVASGPGSFATGSTTRGTVSGGVASFNNLVLTKAGSYTLGAGSGGLAAAASGSFTVSAAAADHLTFVAQPGPASVGQALTPAVQVAVEDAYGNVVSTDTSSVTLTLGGNTGSTSLGGTLTQSAVSGVASFADLSVSGSGAGFTLQASDGTLGGATSADFTAGQVSLSGTSVSEFRPVGTVVGNLALNEGGGGHVVAYRLVNGPGSTDNALFKVRGNQLQTAGVFDFSSRSAYSVRVRGTDETGQSFEQSFTISILNDPHLSRIGKVLTVTGTKGNDNFTFTPGAVWDSLTLNGVKLAVDSTKISTVVFQGGGGSDSATLTGASSGANTLSLSPGQGTLSGKGYSVQLSGMAHILVNAGGSNDSATLHGGTGTNTFTGSGKSAVLAGSGYSLGLSGFRKVTVYATAGAANKKSVHAVDYVFVALGKWS